MAKKLLHKNYLKKVVASYNMSYNLEMKMLQENFLLAQSGGSALGPILPFVLVFLVVYFLIIRPQTKRQQMLENKKRAMQKGDNVVTAGGLLGKVEQFKDEDRVVVVNLGNSIKVSALRATVQDVLIEVDKKGNRIDGKQTVVDAAPAKKKSK